MYLIQQKKILGKNVISLMMEEIGNKILSSRTEQKNRWSKWLLSYNKYAWRQPCAVSIIYLYGWQS